MATGVVPGVIVLPSADRLSLPPPPGVVLVASTDAEGTALQLLRALAVDEYHDPGEAKAELVRRRELDLSSPRDHARRCRVGATAAWAEAEAALARLSPRLAGLDPAAVRRAARAVAAALEALDTARSTLGRRPPFDGDAARAAHQAQHDVERARRERWSGIPQANARLTMANVGAGALVAGRLVTDAFDPAFFLVAVLPLGALGYTAHTVIRSVRRRRGAARRRWMALRSQGVSTMAGLAALEARAGAWTHRAGRLKVAESDVACAEAAWRSLVGEGVAVADADGVVSDLETLAQLDRRATAMAAAWAEAALVLQRAEDLAGRAHPPLVILDSRRSSGSEARRRGVEELAGLAGAASVVVVVRKPARTRPAVPSVADADLAVPASENAVVVDLRDRVLAGLHRLRSRSGRYQRPSPGSAAADG